ncbi:PREDICTED: uncharacterized protein LOC105314247 [Amphimedon queenslandica]|uniref:Amidinotransferase n=1 Tax=Amphimedon queenslandica TaxID=400682 RepID=A0A1X7VTH3_AMPQE|nr:PREDICTED: uncharacterized protein LOC105314247 [Amphimedon queenslandica]|eukprot:XP_011406610.1 PREDICTED: uncharacterized protein LOC105314247 [Amphimedon queenslandica]
MSFNTANTPHQVTNRVMMIRPKAFGYNSETAVDNAFQISSINNCSSSEASAQAVREFDDLSHLLSSNGIEVNIEADTDSPETPDAVFPNNWISFHSSTEIKLQTTSTIIIYPMMSILRRQERRQDLIDKWTRSLNASIIDLSSFESSGQYLEGTGSMVLDRVHRVAYACVSGRTDIEMIEKFCSITGYKSVTFRACHKSLNGDLVPIYHTNVMMMIGKTISLICLEAIQDSEEKERVMKSLGASGRTIVTVTVSQMNDFLCNALELSNQDGKRFLVMSTKAYNAMDGNQKRILTEENELELVHCSVDTIESLGGGGVRCMIAEIFPPK